MAESLAVAMRPDSFKCKKKGDQEQMLQDFNAYKKKIGRYLLAAKVVAAHTGAQPDSTHNDHEACASCQQEKAIMLMLGGDDMDKLFEHVGKVEETDTFHKALNKVQAAIKGLTNSATARYKLFQEMPQDGQTFSSWAQLVVEQADRCDWVNYGAKSAARDAILFQIDDVKLKKKILAENTALEQVIKLGIASEQANKNASRINSHKQEAGGDRISALEEQVRALKAAKGGSSKVDKDCTTCTRPFHAPGKCKGLEVECFDCKKTGHFRGSKACKKPRKHTKKDRVRAVEKDKDTDSADEETNSDEETSNRVTETGRENLVNAAQERKQKQVHACMKVVVLDKNRPSRETHMKMLIDSGVHKTLVSEEDWKKVKRKKGEARIKLKICKTKFKPFGTDYHLPILGRTKCTLEAAGGAKIKTIVYVVEGECQSLLGLRDSEKLGIIKIDPEGAVKEEQVIQLSQSKKLIHETGWVAGQQSQGDIEAKMIRIMDRHCNIFKGIGRAKVEPVHIEVDPEVKPKQQKRRPIAIHYVDRFKAHLMELQEAGVVTGPLESEDARGWISNPVITGKKWDTTKIRVNLDTTHMNDAVKTSHFPIPTVKELRHNFKGSERFSVLDLNHAFHQFEMDASSKKLFAFYTPWGLYRYNTLVMGTAPASSECHERIRKVVEGLEGVQQIKDDLVVHGSKQTHDERLEKALQRLEEFGLTLRRDKCKMGVPEVSWFGHIFSEQGMSPDPAKVQTIKEWPAPTDKSEVKSFLQTVQFCQEYMRPGSGRTYSDVTQPLRRLTAKAVQFNWDRRCEASFQELKALLCHDTVMAPYDPAKQTRVYVDHGPGGVAATVAQNHGQLGAQDSWRPVHYSSRSLTETEAGYSKVDGESLGVLSGILNNKMYLYGTRFQVIVDHKPLVALYKSNRRDLPVRVARHKSKLGGFNFEVSYEPGSTTPSDYGSRHPPGQRRYTRQERESLGVEDEEEETEFIVNKLAEIPEAVTLPVLRHYTDKDKVLPALMEDIRRGRLRADLDKNRYKECFKECSIMDSVVLRGERFIIPEELRPDILAASHEGHPGIVSMLTQLRAAVWWPGMTTDVNTYVETCNEGCAASVEKNSPPPMVVRETPELPWQHVAADFKGPIQGNGKSYYFHVIIDLLSRWPEVAVVTSTAFDKLVPSMEKVWSLHGIPETVTSDNGPPYQSRDWRKYAKIVGFQHKPCSPEHPEGNGVAERFMATIVKVVHAAIAEKKDPKIEIDRRLLNYRNTIHPSTGKTPSQLMMRRIIRTKIPRMQVKLNPEADLEEAREKDKETRLERKEKRDKRKTAREKNIQIGDKVLIAQRKTTTKPPYDPKAYEVVDIKGTQITASRGSKTRVRNMAKVKVLKERPKRLQCSAKHTTSMEDKSDEEDWLDIMPRQDQAQQQLTLDRDMPRQEEEADHHHEQQQQEEGARGDLGSDREEFTDPIAVRKGTRLRKMVDRLGITATKTSSSSSPSKRERKKKQGEARRKAKREVWVLHP